MLHIHFGAGRLGLGLVSPFFQSAGSKLYILNRGSGGARPTGETACPSARRNALLAEHPRREYVIAPPGDSGGASGADGAAGREIVRYDGFATYEGENAEDAVRAILREADGAARDGVVVTASVLKPENYRAVLRVLDVLAGARGVGPLFLVACENSMTAADVFEDPVLADLVTAAVRERVTPVAALVDRICVELEEDQSGPLPTVLVRAEPYGSLKLQLGPETEALVPLLEGSRVEFSRHVETEKQVKSWLLNGSHWLIALAAFSESEGNRELKLNEFLRERPDRVEFASTVMREMQDGVAAILRSDPQYAAFVHDVDPDWYLDGASRAILNRFLDTEDPITRILARFQAPSPESHSTIEAFSRRFTDRVGLPLTAYERDYGVPPRAATQSILGLVKLLASGTFIDAQDGMDRRHG